MSIRELTVFFSYRWVSSKEDYDRILESLHAVLAVISTSLERAQAQKILSEQVKLPLVGGLIRTVYMHALQGARFGEVERKMAKEQFDANVDYLLQIKRPLTD